MMIMNKAGELGITTMNNTEMMGNEKEVMPYVQKFFVYELLEMI